MAHCCQHGEERGSDEFLQGIDAEAADDGAEIDVFVLACTNADTSIQQGHVDVKLLGQNESEGAGEFCVS